MPGTVKAQQMVTSMIIIDPILNSYILSYYTGPLHLPAMGNTCFVVAAILQNIRLQCSY